MLQERTLSGIHVCGHGPGIVLLHSSLSSAKQWLPLVLQMKEYFTCINIDILGYGQAPKVTDLEHYNFDVELMRIRTAIEHYLGAQAYHLVGHSCGGAIALKLAVEAPDKLFSLSLFEPVAFHLLAPGSENRLIAERFSDEVADKDNYAAATIFTDFWNQQGFFNAQPKKMQQLMAADMPKVNLDFKGLISEKYTVQDLAKISAKSLLMTGKDSPDLGHYLADKIAQGLVNVKQQCFDGGHMAPISHAQQVQSAIADFIHAV